MTTKTLNRKQAAPVDPDTLAEEFIDALGRRDAARRNATRASLTDGAGYYRESASLAAADEAVRTARAALETAAGPAAVRLAEARAAHRPIAAELTSAQNAWRGPSLIAELAARERAADLRVRQAAEEADAERARAATRELLEAQERPLLDELTAGLTEARSTLVDAVQAAHEALAAVHRAAVAYGAQAAGAARQLTAKGFDGTTKFNGQQWPTTSTPLRVQGADWPTPHPDRLVLWALHEAVVAHGWGGQAGDYALRPLIGVDERIIRALLGGQPARGVNR